MLSRIKKWLMQEIEETDVLWIFVIILVSYMLDLIYSTLTI